MRDDWDFIADLASVQRINDDEIRLALLQSPKGYAVQIRRFQRSPHTGEMIAGGFSLVVFSERIPELILALDKGHRAAAALREAAHA